jgi:transposase
LDRILVEPKLGEIRALASELSRYFCQEMLNTARINVAVSALPVVVVNPRQARDFTKANGLLEETDKIDCGAVALSAGRVQPQIRALKSEEAQEFEALLARRQLQEMLTAGKNRRGTAHPAVKKRLAQHIRWLEKELDHTEAELDRQIKASPIWRAQDELLRSVPGVRKRRWRWSPAWRSCWGS